MQTDKVMPGFPWLYAHGEARVNQASQIDASGQLSINELLIRRLQK
jgi:hypothetical protein